MDDLMKRPDGETASGLNTPHTDYYYPAPPIIDLEDRPVPRHDPQSYELKATRAKPPIKAKLTPKSKPKAITPPPVIAATRAQPVATRAKPPIKTKAKAKPKLIKATPKPKLVNTFAAKTTPTVQSAPVRDYLTLGKNQQQHLTSLEEVNDLIEKVRTGTPVIKPAIVTPYELAKKAANEAPASPKRLEESVDERRVIERIENDRGYPQVTYDTGEVEVLYFEPISAADAFADLSELPDMFIFEEIGKIMDQHFSKYDLYETRPHHWLLQYSVGTGQTIPELIRLGYYPPSEVKEPTKREAILNNYMTPIERQQMLDAMTDEQKAQGLSDMECAALIFPLRDNAGYMIQKYFKHPVGKSDREYRGNDEIIRAHYAAISNSEYTKRRIKAEMKTYSEQKEYVDSYLEYYDEKDRGLSTLKCYKLAKLLDDRHAALKSLGTRVLSKMKYIYMLQTYDPEIETETEDQWSASALAALNWLTYKKLLAMRNESDAAELAEAWEVACILNELILKSAADLAILKAEYGKYTLALDVGYTHSKAIMAKMLTPLDESYEQLASYSLAYLKLLTYVVMWRRYLGACMKVLKAYVVTNYFYLLICGGVIMSVIATFRRRDDDQDDDQGNSSNGGTKD